MSTIDTLGGGNIEPRGLEEEMRSAYLDYAMSVIVGRALPDVTRRPQAGPPPRPARDERDGPAAEPQARQVRADRRRGDGQVPPARRQRDLRHARAHGAELLDALHARRRARQLRQRRRLARGRHALHRGAPRPPRDRDAARHRPGHGRLRSDLRRQHAASRWCCRRASRTCSSTAAPASPSAWRPTSRRTTCARSSPRRSPTSTTRRSTSRA